MAAASFSETLWLRERARSLTAGLLARLEEYVWDYPTDTPKEIIDLLKAVLACVSLRIESSNDRLYLASLGRLVQTLASTLTFFDNAHTEQTPRALAQMLEDLTNRIRSDVKLVVWPQVDYNFTIRDILPPLKKSLDNVLTPAEKTALFANFKGPLNLVSFPRIERDNIFVHAIFGHELGHPVADEFLTAEKSLPKYAGQLLVARKQILQSYSSEISRLQRMPFKRFQLEAGLTREVLRIRQRGLQELVSDVVAVYLFGPSAVFAAFDIFAGGNLDALPTNTGDLYPPDRMRFRIMLEVLREERFLETIKGLPERDVRDSAEELITYLQGLTRADDDQKAIAGHRECSVAYDWIKQSLPDAMTFAKTKLAPVLYAAKKLETEVPELLARLQLKIPPNETGAYPHVSTVDWRSSIAAAWLWRICRSGDVRRYSMHFPDDEMRELQRITTLAIELSLLRLRYEEYAKGKGASP